MVISVLTLTCVSCDSLFISFTRLTWCLGYKYLSASVCLCWCGLIGQSMLLLYCIVFLWVILLCCCCSMFTWSKSVSLCASLCLISCVDCFCLALVFYWVTWLNVYYDWDTEKGKTCWGSGDQKSSVILWIKRINDTYDIKMFTSQVSRYDRPVLV